LKKPFLSSFNLKHLIPGDTAIAFISINSPARATQRLLLSGKAHAQYFIHPHFTPMDIVPMSIGIPHPFNFAQGRQEGGNSLS